MLDANKKKVIIVGAGPAGLTAAYELCRQNVCSVILEKDVDVGGLAKTINYKGFHFDIGGHRFFTKIKPVEEMWRSILGDDFLRRRRLSRIYFNHKFFYYPLRPANALLGLGLGNSLLILASYLKAKLFPEKPAETFERWVSNRFGKRLYRIFFKTYTEKVWGIPCNEIRAEWAAQRIRGLSMLKLITSTLLNQNNNSVKTLIDSFDYPRLGPGMMWRKVAEQLQGTRSQILLQSDVQAILCNDNRIEGIEIRSNGKSAIIHGTDFISTMPIRELIQKLQPAAPDEILEASRGLNYRDFLTVALVINKRDVFPDNWIYIHDPDVHVGRIQNFKNWSPDMVPDTNKTCLGLEYFCFEGDGLWNCREEKLIELAKHELQVLGLANPQDVTDGIVVRVPKAYPVYDSTYAESLQKIRHYLERYSNLQLIGRNGMHKYNNQDHSMLTGMLAARNVLGANYDLWRVNVDESYQEEILSGEDTIEKQIELLQRTQPSVPERIPSPIAIETLLETFARIDKLAFAAASGTVCGLAIFTATLFLILKGGAVIGPNFELLSQYFIGYTVTLKGAIIGFGYSFFWGFLFGWLFAYLRNLSVGMFLYYIKRKQETTSLQNLLDYI